MFINKLAVWKTSSDQYMSDQQGLLKKKKKKRRRIEGTAEICFLMDYNGESD